MTARTALPLADMRAIVTGSESGLGRAIVAAFVAGGAAVAGIDISVLPSASGELAPEGYRRFRGDITDRDGISLVIEDALSDLGGVDVCVNCAGIGGRSDALSYPDDLWDRVIAVNLTGSFTVARLVGARMVTQGSGSIVNIASVGGLVGWAGSVGYQVTKGGIVQLTRSLAAEWGQYGVRVNAIAPGHIATELVQKIWKTEPELKDFFLSRTPLGRLGDPADVAHAAVYLGSDASRMVTGQVLVVDGGFTSGR